MDSLNNNSFPKTNKANRSPLIGIISSVSSTLGLFIIISILTLNAFGLINNRLSTFDSMESSLPMDLLYLSLIVSLIGFVLSFFKISSPKNGPSLAGLILSIFYFILLLLMLQSIVSW